MWAAEVTASAGRKEHTMKKLLTNHWFITFITLTAATILAFVFFYLVPQNSANIALLYILALLVVTLRTTGYRYGIFAALFSVICINFLFTYPYFHLNFTLTGYPITFIGMLAITLITATTAARLKKQAAIIAEREKTIKEAEREKIRANLLRAVSHDLRTPLTSIIGASSSFLEGEDYLSEEEKRELITNINNDSNWLLNMVENLLSVTRIQEDGQKVKKSPEVVEEVVSEAAGRLKKRLPDAQFNIHVPLEFLMVPMDAILIEQVLINLLENAVIHSGSDRPAELSITENEGTIIFEIKDYGRGLDDSQLDNLFLGTYSASETSDGHKGMGIGLSICRTIVEAHGGQISARNHEHGAVFTFTLPKT